MSLPCLFNYIGQGSESFSCKAQNSKYFRLVSHMAFFVTSQFCPYNVKAAKDNTYMNACEFSKIS